MTAHGQLRPVLSGIPERAFAAVLAGLTALAVLIASPALSAPYAAIVMDARDGKVLHAENADTRLHPASLTKMLTLYIVFEAVEHGEISLDTMVEISRKAASEPPSRLGLRAGQRIKLRYLIRAAAVKSANDAATALAEAIEGSEAAFARRMNRTAKALGMTRSTFRNAHGLTAPGHLSTARDMAILGRHLFYDYPEYYNLFSRQRTDAGLRTVNSTNRRFLNAYRGADGIKTGYTSAAGFNLVASAERGGVRLIAAIFGGRSSAQRDARMAALLDLGFARAPRRVAVRPPVKPPYGGEAAPPTAMATLVARSPRPAGRPAAAGAPLPEDLVAAIREDVHASVESTRAEASPSILATPGLPAVAPRPRPEDIAPPARSAPPASAQGEGSKEAALVLVPPGRAVGVEDGAGAGADAPTGPAEGAEPIVVVRMSSSGGRLWGVRVGRYTARYTAEQVLLRTALSEIDTLGEALRKVVARNGGYEATFVGLTQEGAALACRRLLARGQPCETLGPTG